MKILLVDDTLRHRRAGVEQLHGLGHEVVAVASYGDVRRVCREHQFDAALLDLMMPAEPDTLGPEAIVKHVGTETPIGFGLLAYLVFVIGVRKVAIATDTNHHHHPASAFVDWFGWGYKEADGLRILVRHAPVSGDGVKDWAAVFKELDTDTHV